ncbi:MAG TPA: HAMP domain-containing histidine kinase [Hellea balneolensis]|uniref:histidine kinase n=1 Tax=Hellea balneolensis TaxID=287478 RepID=A0A7C5R0M3_9PROT|nr:HAMP domain-containing histidine kinase [Hellea balneolensis]
MLVALKRLLKNTVFRLSMIAAALFVASSLVVLGYIYYATVISELARIDHEMEAEINELSEIFNTQGPAALNKEIFSRVTDLGTSSTPNRTFYVYEYFDERGMPYGGGNLPAKRFFADPEHIPFWKRIPGTDYKKTRVFEYTVPLNNEDNSPMVTRRARGQLKVFKPYSAKLFIARDVEGIMAPAERVTRTLLISMLIATTLGLISGFYVSKRFARRIGAFNKLARDVRAGDLKRRFKRDETGDELDNLAGHLNDMLDHIDRLMMAMRYAGDSIAHDLRSPLTRLRTRLEAAAADVKDEDAQIALYSASEDANELLRTFENVLRIARLEAGEQREMLVPLDPVPLLEDIAELYEPACEDAGLDFALEIEGKHTILADRGLLSQAVSNLVENAIKYTPQGRAITVRLRKIRSGRTEISVTDTGPGIPVDERERVKERFVRLDKSRTASGSGLGLAFVDAVADLHKAEFELTDGPGGAEAEFPGLRAALIFPRYKRNK